MKFLPARFDSYQQLSRWLSLIIIGSNSLGAFLTFFYLSYIAPLPSAGKSIADAAWTDFIPVAIGTILLLATGGWMGRRRERHFPQWFDRLIAGADPSQVPLEAKREILQYPFWTMLTSLTMWLIAGVTFGFFLARSGRAFVGIFLVGGLFTSVSIYYSLELTWRKVIPIYFAQGGVSAAKVFHFPILPRLLATFFLVSVYPLGMVILLSLERARNIMLSDTPAFYMRNMWISELFIFIVATLASILLAVLVTRSIVDPLNELQKSMSLVQKNDLNAAIPIKSNDEMGLVTEHFNDMVGGLRRGELFRNLLNVYVSPEVAREAVEHGTQLGGQLVECTILFSDLRSFTALSEQLPPTELISLLNRYMETMIEIIVSRGGVVNKFGGDSILAVFGTPLNPDAGHASSGVKTAIAMRDELVLFNRRQKEVAGPQLHCGIAVATGKVVAGNVGGKARIEYTVIGDTVNLAARLQALSKDLKHDILLNAEAFAQASQQMDLRADEIPNLTIRGKVEPVTIYVL